MPIKNYGAVLALYSGIFSLVYHKKKVDKIF